jgi:hypothetical protein
VNRPIILPLCSVLTLLLLGAAPVQISRACTLWGAAGADAGGGTIVSKNRDWKPDHLQVLKMHRDGKGYAYLGLYAEGNDSPGLKQGINEKGLAVATATAGSIPKPTRTAQAGRGGLAGTLLSGYATCDQVLADQKKLFSGRRPVFVMISDRKKILMLEVGLKGRYALKVVESGTAVHSNHFLEETMQEFNLKVGSSSATRASRIQQLLATTPAPYDAESFARMSRDHQAGPDHSLWRIGTNGSTLSSWIIETPAQGPPRLRVLLANPGQPEELRQFVLDKAFWTRPLTSAPFHATSCEGTYPRHLQGICTNDRDAIYWSWTESLVKTDIRGKVLRQVKVADHHGDLCFHDDKVYVTVNLGQFNRPAGEADSWVFVYDADTLAEFARHAVPELVHGAGGIGYHHGKFILVGGLPEGAAANLAYEYDARFTFQKRHVLAGGYTVMGIQTAAFASGAWWFGCYGEPRVLLRADPNLQLSGRYEFDAALGIAPLADGRFLIGRNTKAAGGGYEGRVVLARPDEQMGLVLQ